MRNRSLVSLFSGIGGFEVAARTCGINSSLLCEIDPDAQAILRKRFPNARLVDDVRAIQKLPGTPWMITAGFPCQDLSSVGQKNGIRGDHSSLIDEVFRLLKVENPDWVILENVMFMLHLGKGAAMEHVIGGLEKLGFNWAYRLLNTIDFGLPQRRRRVYFVASRKHNAAAAMFHFKARSRRPTHSPKANGTGCFGFYWTEGMYATGITENGIPPLKSGSTIGIPSPPAVLFADGTVGTPTIGDAERLQGFRKGWTQPARARVRWRLAGNAVSVPVARHVIRSAIKATGVAPKTIDGAVALGTSFAKWPDAAFGQGGKRYSMSNGRVQGMKQPVPIFHFLSDDLQPLSARATAGFLKRANKGNLRFPPGFLERLAEHESKTMRAK